METRSTLLVMVMMGVVLAGCVESKTYLPPEGFELRVRETTAPERASSRSRNDRSSYGVGGLSNIPR